MPRFFVINAAGAFYSHAPGRMVSWGTINHANEFQSAMSAQYIAERYCTARVVEMRRKQLCEVH